VIKYSPARTGDYSEDIPPLYFKPACVVTKYLKDISQGIFKINKKINHIFPQATFSEN